MNFVSLLSLDELFYFMYLFVFLSKQTRIWFSITIKFLNFKAYKLHLSSNDTCGYHP